MPEKKVILVVPSKVELSVPLAIRFIRHLHFGEILEREKFSFSLQEDKPIRVSIEYMEGTAFVQQYLSGICNFFSKNIFFQEKKVIFFKKIGFLKFGIALEQKSDQEYIFFCTEHYKKYVREKIGSLYPFGIHISDLLQVLSLQKNAFTFYGASFLNIKKQEASLILAPPGVGKTYSLLQLIQKSEYKILGEEVTYVEANQEKWNIFGTPNTSITNTQKHNIAFGWWNLFISKRMESFSQRYGTEHFASEGSLKRIYILEHSTSESVCRLSEIEALQKVEALQTMLFTYESNPLLQPFFYSGILSLPAIQKIRQKFLEQIISSVPVYCLRSPKPKSFSSLIEKAENTEV